MAALVVVLLLAAWAIIGLIRIANERTREAEEDRRRDYQLSKEKKEQEEYGYQPKKEWTSQLTGGSLDTELDESWLLFDEFKTLSEMNENYCKTISIRNFGSSVWAIYHYGRAEWYIEKMVLDKKDRYEDFYEWCRCWKSKGNISQKFSSKAKALEAIRTGTVWFDNDLRNLEAVKEAANTGELLHVKYWGGRNAGKPRYITVMEVNQLEPEEEDEQHIWYAEVLERGSQKEKTYRVDRIQLLKVNPKDFIENVD